MALEREQIYIHLLDPTHYEFYNCLMRYELRHGLKLIPDTEVHVKSYKHKLSLAIHTFNLPTYAFSIDKTATLDAAIRLLHGLQINPTFLDKPENALYTLAVADTWIKTNDADDATNIRGRKGLINILKAIAHNGVQTLSATVQRASQNGSFWGRVFDPQVQVTEEEDANKLFDEKARRFARERKDKQSTEEIKAMLNARGEGSMLHHVRSTSAYADRDIELAVLSLTGQEMAQEFPGSEAFILNQNEIPELMILPQDANLDIIQHESLHFLLPHIKDFFLMMGVDEAWIEDHINNPSVYEEQRALLDDILYDSPLLVDALDQAYLDPTGKAKRDFFALLAQKYGLAGFLAIARMDTGCDYSYDIHVPIKQIRETINIPEENEIKQK